jgi:hypothetical protein
MPAEIVSISGQPICPICRYPVSELIEGVCFLCHLSLISGREPEVNAEPDPVIPDMTCAELDAAMLESIATIQADIEAYEERVALRSIDDNLTTTKRAKEALERTERFRGEHDIARAWLTHHAPENGIFRRKDRE